MKIRVRRVALAVSLLMLAWPAAAYELRTHSAITERSAARSAGFARYLEDAAIDPSVSIDRPSAARPTQLDGYVNEGKPKEWMGEGSIREDDYRELSQAQKSIGKCDPPLNPLSQIDRPFNHFFDVQHNGDGLFVP